MKKQCVRDQQHNTTPEAGAKVHRDNQLDVFTARVCGCCCARNIKVRGGKPAQRLAMGVAELPQGNNVFSVLCQQCMLGGERDLCHERGFFFLGGGREKGGSTSDPSPQAVSHKTFFWVEVGKGEGVRVRTPPTPPSLQTVQRGSTVRAL